MSFQMSFQCRQCNKIYKTENQLYFHVIMAHDDSDFETEEKDEKEQIKYWISPLLTNKNNTNKSFWKKICNKLCNKSVKTCYKNE